MTSDDSPRKVGKNTKPKKIAEIEIGTAARGGSDMGGLSETEESDCSVGIPRKSSNMLKKNSSLLEIKKQKELLRKKANKALALSKKTLGTKNDASKKRLAIELSTDLQVPVDLLTPKKASVRKRERNDRMNTIDEETEEEESEGDNVCKKLQLSRKKSAGKESTKVLPSSVTSVGNELKGNLSKILSDDHVTTITQLFAQRYGNAKEDTEKKDMQWSILRLLHEEAPIPILGEALNQLQASLERVVPVEVGNQFCEEMSIWKNHRPNAFRERTLLFRDQYIAAGMSNDSKRKVLITLELQLRKEGFRFFESNPNQGNTRSEERRVGKEC